MILWETGTDLAICATCMARIRCNRQSDVGIVGSSSQATESGSPEIERVVSEEHFIGPTDMCCSSKSLLSAVEAIGTGRIDLTKNIWQLSWPSVLIDGLCPELCIVHGSQIVDSRL